VIETVSGGVVVGGVKSPLIWKDKAWVSLLVFIVFMLKSTVAVADVPAQLAELTCPERMVQVALESGRVWLVEISCDHCMLEANST
jgi:hypothetical protein